MPEDSAPLSVAPSIHEPGNRKSPLPEWYPAWARELAELYFSGTTCLFVLYGNIHDLIRSPSLDGEKYSNLSEFLATQVFGSWDAVLLHDLAHGLRPLAGSDRQRLQAMVHTLGARIGDPSAWPRDADAILALLDRLVERTLIEEDDSRRLSMAVIFDSAQYLVPLGDLTTLARGQSANLVRFLGWAQNPYIKRHNMAFCLVVDKLSEVNPRLLRSPHVAAIEVPLPDAGQRRHFCEQATKKEGSVRPEALAASEVAELSNGLSLVNL